MGWGPRRNRSAPWFEIYQQCFLSESESFRDDGTARATLPHGELEGGAWFGRKGNLKTNLIPAGFFRRF